MEAKYEITKDQLESIGHYTRMFDVNADRINDLCNSEKDDIVYGYELGKMHSHLMDCFLEMRELTDAITDQKIKK